MHCQCRSNTISQHQQTQEYSFSLWKESVYHLNSFSSKSLIIFYYWSWFTKGRCLVMSCRIIIYFHKKKSSYAKFPFLFFNSFKSCVNSPIIHILILAIFRSGVRLSNTQLAIIKRTTQISNSQLTSI